MDGATAGGSAATHRSVWVVLCPGADGRPGAEYVEGTEAVADRAAQVLRILDGGRVVREYLAGHWSNFSEWVSSPTDYFAASAVRLGSLPGPRRPTDAENLLAGAMRMDTEAAFAVLRGHASTREERRSRPA
jgi:hypothetical protein